MRYLIALLAMTAPAMAHPGHAVHMHESDLLVLAGVAFVFGASLTGAAVLKAVKVRK